MSLKMHSSVKCKGEVMNKNIIILFGVISVSAFSSDKAFAQEAFSLNYDNLSFVEEPLAYDLGPATLDVSGLADQGAAYDFNAEDDFYNTRVNGLANLRTQLPNSWHVGVQYFASYNRLANDEYVDNLAAFVSDEWGTISLGNVTGSVRENVRRARGVGNADIRIDNFYGQLDEVGAFYSVRHNAYTFSMTADAEGRAEAGLTFSRPVGQSVYGAGLRLRKADAGEGNFISGDGKTYGGLAVGTYSFTNWTVDVQAGYENIERSGNDNINRGFASAGGRIKEGAASLSVEGMIGHVENSGSEHSIAVGGRYDLARGASLNLGYNKTQSDAVNVEQAIISLRYDF